MQPRGPTGPQHPHAVPRGTAPGAMTYEMWGEDSASPAIPKVPSMPMRPHLQPACPAILLGSGRHYAAMEQRRLESAEGAKLQSAEGAKLQRTASEDSSLGKASATGSHQFLVILSKQQAMDIYTMRSPDFTTDANLKAVAGKSSMVAEMYGVSPKTIRDIWNRKTWTQVTRSAWTTTEAEDHAVEQAHAKLPLSERAALKDDLKKRRGRPPGSKDSRPRRRRLKSGEEGGAGELEGVMYVTCDDGAVEVRPIPAAPREGELAAAAASMTFQSIAAPPPGGRPAISRRAMGSDSVPMACPTGSINPEEEEETHRVPGQGFTGGVSSSAASFAGHYFKPRFEDIDQTQCHEPGYERVEANCETGRESAPSPSRLCPSPTSQDESDNEEDRTPQLLCGPIGDELALMSGSFDMDEVFVFDCAPPLKKGTSFQGQQQQQHYTWMPSAEAVQEMSTSYVEQHRAHYYNTTVKRETESVSSEWSWFPVDRAQPSDVAACKPAQHAAEYGVWPVGEAQATAPAAVFPSPKLGHSTHHEEQWAEFSSQEHAWVGFTSPAYNL